MADHADGRGDVARELRALGRDVAVPPAPDLTEDVRRRVEEAGGRPRGLGTRPAPARRTAWQAAVTIVAVLLAVLVATPQGRAVITHVLRFSGIEVSDPPTPSASPRPGGSLPGRERMSLRQARGRVTFPILVPARLGAPDAVVVGDRGRVVTLAYHHTAYGEVRLDEFDGHVDRVYFEKLAYEDTVSATTVGGRRALWIRGPHEISYVTRHGDTDTASARLTHGNTLIWNTGRAAVRIEGAFGERRARSIAASAR